MLYRNKWTEDEINILKEHYSNGLLNILKMLPNHSKNSISKKAKKFNLLVDKENLYYDKDEITKLVKDSISYADIFRKLNKSKSGDSYKILKNFIKRNNINTEHFDSWKNNRVYTTEKPISHYLINGSNIGSSHLKDKLYKYKLKDKICEICGQDEYWKNIKISLILDHINGVNNDNRIENLRIVCPNCNAGLDTHCRGYKGIKIDDKYKNIKIDDKYKNIKIDDSKIKYCDCGKIIKKSSSNCKKCNEIKQRKVERPSVEQLKKDVEELGYRGTGRKYNVSDNTIRKWIK